MDAILLVSFKCLLGLKNWRSSRHAQEWHQHHWENVILIFFLKKEKASALSFPSSPPYTPHPPSQRGRCDVQWARFLSWRGSPSPCYYWTSAARWQSLPAYYPWLGTDNHRDEKGRKERVVGEGGKEDGGSWGERKGRREGGREEGRKEGSVAEQPVYYSWSGIGNIFDSPRWDERGGTEEKWRDGRGWGEWIWKWVSGIHSK